MIPKRLKYCLHCCPALSLRSVSCNLIGMNARTKQFWMFQGIFWAVAGAALFISGLTQMPAEQALVRNLFLLLAGFMTSFFLAMAIDELRWLTMLRLRVASYGLAYVVALFCVVVINAISFTLRGVDLSNMNFGQWVSGAMNLGLVYAFWSELFIQQIYLSDAKPESKTPENIVVEHRGTLVPLKLAEVESIAAAGDYVEINANDRTFLKRQTLHSLASSHGDSLFVRVHRSALVNRHHVQSVSPLGKGRYLLRLSGGSDVTSSRGYRDAIRDHFLGGRD